MKKKPVIYSQVVDVETGRIWDDKKKRWVPPTKANWARLAKTVTPRRRP